MSTVVERMTAITEVVSCAHRLVVVGTAPDGSIMIGPHGWYDLRRAIARLAKTDTLV